METIKAWLDGFENLTPIGRSVMFKYNHQDHAIYTGLLAARRALGLGRYDPWLINNNVEYHEALPPKQEKTTKARPLTAVEKRKERGGL
jgi:hypothetical protein